MKKQMFLALAIIMAFWLVPEPVRAAPVSTAATPISAGVLVNGEATVFDAYSIDGGSYFKLRDLAYVLNGTEAQFAVDWDADTSTIQLTGGTAYTVIGEELAAGAGAAEAAAVSVQAALSLDGAPLAIEAYDIGGYTYLNLRALGDALGFAVGWDAGVGAITIDAPLIAEETAASPEDAKNTEAPADVETRDGASSSQAGEPSALFLYLLIGLGVLAVILVVLLILLIRGGRAKAADPVARAPLRQPIPPAAPIAPPEPETRTYSFCPSCGKRLQAANRFCPHCGGKVRH